MRGVQVARWPSGEMARLFPANFAPSCSYCSSRNSQLAAACRWAQLIVSASELWVSSELFCRVQSAEVRRLVCGKCAASAPWPRRLSPAGHSDKRAHQRRSFPARSELNLTFGTVVCAACAARACRFSAPLEQRALLLGGPRLALICTSGAPIVKGPGWA